MRKEVLTITDLTRMSGDRVCIAGYTPDLTCVRPELARGFFTESWLVQDSSGIVRPFSKVEFDLDRHIPDPPHTEDWVVSPGKPRVRGHLLPAERMSFLSTTASQDVESIFGAPVHHEWGMWVAAGEGHSSLGTVNARVWDIFHDPKESGGWEYRLVFGDNSGKRHALSVTDLAFRLFLDHERAAGRISGHSSATSVVSTLKASRQVYLRIGLARHWAKFPDRCYLQVNGVYSEPDYLGGRCFADFANPTSPNPPGSEEDFAILMACLLVLHLVLSEQSGAV